MNANTMRNQEVSEQIDDREAKALTEVMTVLGDLPEVSDSPDRYAVVTESGKQYEVNVALETCTCPDHEYRDNTCKHIHRVRHAIGLAETPDWIDEDAIDDELGAFVPTKREPDTEASSGREVATDGGTKSSSSGRDDYIPVGVDSAGAHHVYRTTDETVHVIDVDAGERTERYDFDEMPGKGINEWIVYVDERRGWDIQQLFVNMAGAVANAVRSGA